MTRPNEIRAFNMNNAGPDSFKPEHRPDPTIKETQRRGLSIDPEGKGDVNIHTAVKAKLQRDYKPKPTIRDEQAAAERDRAVELMRKYPDTFSAQERADLQRWAMWREARAVEEAERAAADDPDDAA